MSQDTVDFGASLCQARERRGVSLRQIADATKISVPALEALERNEIARLPGGIFSRSFVRAYAREVGLDPEQAVRDFVARFPSEDPAAEAGPLKSPAREHLPIEPEPRSWRGVTRVLRVVVPVALVVAYVVWSGRLASWRWGGAVVPAVPPASQTSPAASSPPPVRPQAGGATSAQSPEPPQAGQPPAPSGAGAPETTTPRPGVGAGQQSGLRMIADVRRECWVSLKADGTVVFSGLMRAGDRRELGANEEIVVTVGDAAAFAFTLNGQPARPLGTSGQVVTVVITTQNYMTFLQTP
jgi:cytoskeleton protein RodZ